MKKLACIGLFFAIACTDQNETTKPTLKYDDLKIEIQDRTDFKNLISGMLNDYTNLTTSDPKLNAEINRQANLLAEKAQLTGSEFQDFRKLTVKFSPETLPSLISLRNFLEQYTYSLADLKALVVETISSRARGTQTSGRTAMMYWLTPCQFQCALNATQMIGESAQHLYYLACSTGCSIQGGM
jgi:hypothetical protein